MNALQGLYPFFLLGRRRMSERAGALGIATFIIAAIAFTPAAILAAGTWIVTYLPFDLQEYLIDTPHSLYITMSWSIVLGCFIVPFFAAGISDLFFRVDWRANSILLASPMPSRTLFWGKYVLLLTVGLPVLLALIPPLGTIFLLLVPSGQAFIGITAAGFAVYLVSTLYLSGFSRRWEAIVFWITLIPISLLARAIVYWSVGFLNYVLDQLHLNYPNDPRVILLPVSVPQANIPLWLPVTLALVLTLFWLLRRGSLELEKMRSGKIPLGRLTRKSMEDYRKKRTAQWLRPAYSKISPASRRELYIPVQPGAYAATSTDHVFNLIVFIAFLGKNFVRWLLKLIPENTRENPIYVRHTARFRGFLDRYFEPSGMFKSKIVLTAVSVGFLLFFILLGLGIGSSGQEAMKYLTGTILFIFIGMALISPIDAYIKLSREHTERMAWESVILAPIPGRSLLSGSLGVLVAHRLVPFLPATLYICFFGALAGFKIHETLIVLFFIQSVYFIGLSMAASLAWFVAKKTLWAGLITLWGVGFIGFIRFLFLNSIFTTSELSFMNLSIERSDPIIIRLLTPEKLSMGEMALFIVSGLVIGAVGIAMVNLLGLLFDRNARLPLNRRTEDAE